MLAVQRRATHVVRTRIYVISRASCCWVKRSSGLKRTQETGEDTLPEIGVRDVSRAEKVLCGQ
jgi:hypothetical protein